MIACPNCGGNTKFDIASQQILCEFCDTKFRGIYMPYWAYYFTQQGEFCINGKIGCSNFPFIKFIFNINLFRIFNYLRNYFFPHCHHLWCGAKCNSQEGKL